MNRSDTVGISNAGGLRIRRTLVSAALMALALGAATAPGVRGHLSRTFSKAIEGSSFPRPQFSDPPTNDEFMRAGLFVQPLIAVGPTSPDENRQLARLVVAYSDAIHQGNPDDVQSLADFASQHPSSAWTPGLQLDLGAVYRRTGHFTKALTTWQAAWDGAHNLSSADGHAVGDMAAAYLSQFEAYLGRKELLVPLLDEIKARPVRGAAAELISESARGVAEMESRPDVAFKCGPSALKRILQQAPTGDPAASRRILDEAKSTPQGLSLTAVQAISVEAGMNYQMAYRSPGAQVIIPAVVNWKVGHYAALLGQDERDRLLVADATFGEDIAVTRTTFDEEASGYYLVPSGSLPDGWRSVSADEGDRVWGRGDTFNNHDNHATGRPEVQAFPCNHSSSPTQFDGCTSWNVEAAVVGLELRDDPIGYKPPFGPEIRFAMTYSHRDMEQPDTAFTYTNFGNKWTFDWLSYVIDQSNITINPAPVPLPSLSGPGVKVPLAATGPLFQADLYRRGGGDEPYIFPNLTTAAPQPNGTAQVSFEGQFSQGILTRNVSATGAISFTRTLPDGSVEKFTLPGSTPAPGAKYFMTEVDDPQGNAVKINYDGQLRITQIVDAAGQKSVICYANSGAPCTAGINPPTANNQVTEIIDPFNRFARFGYDAQTGHLITITDVLNITSTYQYGQGTASIENADFIGELQTPYGNTTFTFGDTSLGSYYTSTERALQAVETSSPTMGTTPPRTSRVEFRQGTGDHDGLGCNPATSAVDPSIGTSLLDDTFHIECVDGWMPTVISLPNNVAIQNTLLQFRNTFVWNPKQYAIAFATPKPPYPYLDAKVMHWLHTDYNPNSSSVTASRVLESVKEPLESRVWFAYPNQSANVFGNSLGVGTTSQPTNIVRAVGDGSGAVQNWQYQYDYYGHVTQSIDPVGRTLSMTYDPINHVDLLSVKNITPATSSKPAADDVLVTLGSYVQHRPQQITGADGLTTTLKYNAVGQLLSSTDPEGNTWTNTYTMPVGTSPPPGVVCTPAASCGSLTGIVGPSVTLPANQGGGVQTPTYAFTRDYIGRVHSAIGPANELITYSYDNADHLTETQFPDLTTELRNYTLLDLTSTTDRMGNVTTRKYDGFRDLIEIDEPAGRTTTLSYALDGTAQSITDPLGHTTTYTRDVEGRVETIVHPDESTEWYDYDMLGRLWAKSPSQSPNPATPTQGSVFYAYNVDDTVSKAFLDSRAPTVFAYDPDYRRPTGWSRITNGTWAQPTCASGTSCMTLDQEMYMYMPVGFVGANKVEEILTTISPPYVSSGAPETVDVIYDYDSLERPFSRLTSWGVGTHSLSAYDRYYYDAMGRLTSNENPLGSFTYAYADATSRVSGRSSATGPQVAASYWPAQKDGLLQQLTYTTPTGTQLAQYGYVYDDRHNVTSFYDSNSGTTSYGYDAYSQLTGATLPPLPSPARSPTFGATPDAAGNLGALQTVTPIAPPTGLPPSAQYSSTSLTTLGYDVGDKLTQQTTTTTNPVTASLTDAISCDSSVGSLDTIGAGTSGQVTFGYDHSNRLASYTVAIASNAQNISTFLYDGMGRLSTVFDEVDFAGENLVQRSHSYAWCGEERCVEFDNTQQVAVPGGSTTTSLPDALYFKQGTVGAPTTTAPQNSYDITDLLGSERAVVTNNAIAAEYNYNALGWRTTVSGSAMASNRGFTGFYYHAASGLQFARNRVYDASLGRWLTRDPIGVGHAFKDPARFNATDLNLYAYAGNNPQSMVDPSGNSGGFAWASVGAENPGAVRIGPEGVGIFGYDTESSLYAEGIGAVGANLGGESNYVGLYEGKAAEYSVNDGVTTDGISLREGSIGPEIPFLAGVSIVLGVYRQDRGGWGAYLGIHEGFVAEHAAIGVGASLPYSWYPRFLDSWFSHRCPH